MTRRSLLATIGAALLSPARSLSAMWTPTTEQVEATIEAAKTTAFMPSLFVGDKGLYILDGDGARLCSKFFGADDEIETHPLAIAHYRAPLDTAR